MRGRQMIWVGTLFLALMGCQKAVVPPVEVKVAESWQQHQQWLGEYRQWQWQGKFSFRGERSLSGSFRWRQQQDQFNLHVYGPMHLGSAQLQGAPGSVDLLMSDGASRHGASAEEVLWQQQQWRFPVAPLVYWVRGAIVPHEGATVVWEPRRRVVKRVEQLGWLVQFDHYQVVDGLWMPQSIRLERDGMLLKLWLQHDS